MENGGEVEKEGKKGEWRVEDKRYREWRIRDIEKGRGDLWRMKEKASTVVLQQCDISGGCSGPGGEWALPLEALS